MTPGECRCLHKSSIINNGMLHTANIENCVPDHTRECLLRSVSPLLDSSLINRQLQPTDSADTVIAHQFAKRYEILRRENESLRQTVILQDNKIEQLKTIIKSLQSDGYSSESRYDKSSSSSNIPTLRVTPQKRSSTSSSTQTPRSPRSVKKTNRRLHFPETSGSESVPNPIEQNYSSPRINPPSPDTTPKIVRNPKTQNLKTPPMQSSTHPRSLDVMSNIAIGELNTSHRSSRPIAISRTISSQEPTPHQSPVKTPLGFFTRANGKCSDILTANPLPNLAVYLKRFRPDFQRNSERRLEIIRLAAARRAEIEAARKEIAVKISNGEQVSRAEKEVLLVDPTCIKAFTQKEMSALTKKRIVTTCEHIKKTEQKKIEKERKANRILSDVHSERTRMLALHR